MTTMRKFLLCLVFIVDLQNEPCSVFTSSKKDINHIAIILKDDEPEEVEAEEQSDLAPRRIATVNEKRVILFDSLLFSSMLIRSIS